MASTNTQHQEVPTIPTTKLNRYGGNYETWRNQMVYLIHHQGLLGFINGSYTLPQQAIFSPTDCIAPAQINQTRELWGRSDLVLKEWLLSQVEEGVVRDDVTLKTSRDVWLDLQKMFQPDSNTLTTGDNSVEIVTEQHNNPVNARDYLKYDRLYTAALKGDWDAAERIFQDNPSTYAARVDAKNSTALHVAAGAGKKCLNFMSNLLAGMPEDLIATKDDEGDTALSVAAAVGNKEAAILLVKKMNSLLYIPNNLGIYPVHVAVINSQELVLEYLVEVTKDNCETNPYAGSSGISFLISCIEAEFLDLALQLVTKYPYLATLKLTTNNSVLKSVVMKRFVAVTNPFDVILETYGDQTMYLIKRKVQLKLVEHLCTELLSLSAPEAEDIYWDALILATKFDLHYIVEVIIQTFPTALQCVDPTSLQSVYHVAIEHCSLHTLNLIYRKGDDHKHRYLNRPDINGNNILHLVAKLAPPHKLHNIENAALQMLYEVQWYKVVKEYAHPSSSERLNCEDKSPEMIFMEEHKNMREEAEEWYKRTSNSCMIVATLISTIMFAAAITVPGGSNGTSGFPLFSKNSMFTFFAVSDAVSLLSSATSILFFLDIMLSGYKKEDFLSRLPFGMVFGMTTLAVSIMFMVLSFSSLLYLVFGKQHKWVLILVGIAVAYMIIFLLLLYNPILCGMLFPGIEAFPKNYELGVMEPVQGHSYRMVFLPQ